MFVSDLDRGAAYAAYRALERLLSEDGKLPPGFSQDYSGVQVTVVLPSDSVVVRELGKNGDGTILKTAVQNLYGYALWALMIRKLRRFNQWSVIREMIIDCMQEVLRRPTKNIREEIIKEDPEVEHEIERIQKEINIPARVEETPRRLVSELPATVKIVFRKSRAKK